MRHGPAEDAVSLGPGPGDIVKSPIRTADSSLDDLPDTLSAVWRSRYEAASVPLEPLDPLLVAGIKNRRCEDRR